ncbi:hypothetical protein ADK67_27880 [Saccharothrix sp. NRRL B-16348]|uniref:PadR family transcriptional regulator n=1 Tax=Saccharothrix sp. NRRL B-16348 TaxID=1415542 RepID=UPI0006AE71D5|nr:helix-turn-helix transcriptional regulator [Saccharothrix sp. NRRL B-16348]KOX21262.1 hypothetical protein ADK67_27880 [Saccharothrix sp. NRRL B-16348]
MNATGNRILTTLAKAGEQGLDGLGIQAGTALGVGTSYPHLLRLDSAGLVTHRWEQRRPGTPRRRLYQVTDLGRAEARQLELLPPPRSTHHPLRLWGRVPGRRSTGSVTTYTTGTGVSRSARATGSRAAGVISDTVRPYVIGKHVVGHDRSATW